MNHGQPPSRQSLMENKEKSLAGQMEYTEDSWLMGVPNLPIPKWNSE